MKREQTQLPQFVAQLPVQHLQLRESTACAAARMRTIGAAAKHLEDTRPLKLWKDSAREELSSALADMRACVSRDGTVDFARFYTLRRVRNTRGKMYYASEHLQRWVAIHGDIGIGALQLRIHVAGPLLRRGIKTLAQLLKALRVGLSIPRNQRQRFVPELVASLTALDRCSSSRGKIDWNFFAKQLRIPIAGYGGTSRSDEMLSRFYAAVGAAVQFEFGQGAHLVATHRLLIRTGSETKLVDIGRLLGITKEAVRLREASLLADLRRIVWYNDYTSWRCRLAHELQSSIRDFVSEFKLRNRAVFLRTDWDAAAANYFGVERGNPLTETRLLLGLAGLTPFRFAGECRWSALATNSDAVPRLQKARALINKALSVGCPDGLTLAALRGAIAKAQSSAVTDDDVRCLVRSLPDIDYNEKTRRYHVAKSKLRLGDALEQALRAAGRPISLRDFQKTFCDEAGRPRWTLDTIVTEIAKDSRFVAVGLTGKRALREWTQIETRSIVDIAAEIVQAASGPVSEAQLYQAISQRRSLRPKSIRPLLLHDRRFRRVSMGWWEASRRRRRLSG